MKRKLKTFSAFHAAELNLPDLDIELLKDFNKLKWRGQFSSTEWKLEGREEASCRKTSRRPPWILQGLSVVSAKYSQRQEA